MKYKPIVTPWTQIAAKIGNEWITGLTLYLELLSKVNSLVEGSPSVYGCGKQGCTGNFVLISKTERPLVCPKCGSEIDWMGIATKKLKRCPDCGKVGNEWESFCKYHVPAIALGESEEPL